MNSGEIRHCRLLFRTISDGKEKPVEKTNKQKSVWYLVLIAVLILMIRYFEQITGFLKTVGSVAMPLAMGCGIAYVLNIIMSAMERHYFTRKNAPWVEKTRRPVCMAACIVAVLGIIFLLIRVVAPELINAVLLLGEGVPVYVEKGLTWAVNHSGGIPALKEWLESLAIDWPKIIQQFLGSLTDILNSTVELVGVLTGSIVRLFMSLIFGIYLLSGKERLLDQAKRILKVFFKEKDYTRLFHVVTVAHHTFTSYIAGQCTEAVILGSLCTVGMLIFRFPYAPMVGALVGATALLPILGAYIGAIVGAFMILTVSPGQVIPFICFLVILQQLEGNLIYPKVVGGSVGLPGMWILAAVTVGGGLWGIPGMLIGVPMTATVYKLFSEYIHIREKER